MKNDYIIASINNPDFTAEDFRNVAGYTLKDTLMLKEEDYLNNDFIKNNPLFLDSSGIFRKEKFSEFYNKVLNDFENFSNEDFADNYQYSPFDTRRKGKNKVQPFGLTFFNNPNPTMLTIGIEGPNVLGERTLSDREIAQREKIFDTKSGKFLDYSPNDLALFSHPWEWAKSLVQDPLVLAIYDENGTHIDPITHKQVKHQKGQYKLNDNGLPYYERLNGRSLVGRDLLSATDILTIDGSLINKYDFLDSDDTEKSIGGTIMKTVAAIAPLFIPYVNQEYAKYVGYYGSYLMLRELSKTTPMLYAMGTALFNDKPDHLLSNTIAAYANKLTTSTSDYAKLHIFSFENFGNLISDVALQWEQQLSVIRGFNRLNNATNKRIEAAKIKALSEYETETTKLIQEAKLGKVTTARVKELTGAANEKELKALIANNKWELTNYGRVALERNILAIEDYIKNRTVLGLDLSLAYMALISNTDVYSSALEHGASKKEAAALALGSTAGMFSVDKWMGLGEMFFLVPAERQVFRNSLKTEADNALKWLTKEVKEAENPGKYFKIGINTAKRTVRNFRESIANRDLPLLGKAIGEGLEEVSEELVTDMVKSAGELAADFGWISGPTDLGAWDQMPERYAMSLLGGTIGGGIFGLKMLGILNLLGPKELELLVRLNKTQDLRRELKNLYDSGQLGRTDLAAEYEERDNKKIFLTPDDKHVSLNEYAYRLISDAIDLLESIINSERLNKTEDDLFKQLVLKDDRYIRLKSYLLDKSYLTGYQERYQDLVEGIVKNKAELAALGDAKTDEEQIKAKNLEKSIADKELERDRFLSGELSLDYLRKLDFLMNPILTKGFMNLTRDDFARAITGADYRSLDLGQRMLVEKLYAIYLKTGQVKNDATKAYNSFKDLSAKIGQPIMNLLEELRPSYDAWELNIQALEDTKQAAAWDWDEKIEGESDEDFENRDTKMEGEDDIEFLLRLNKRQEMITQHNENIYNYLLLALSQGVVLDATSKRRLNLILQKTEYQIKKNLLRSLNIKDPGIGQEIMAGTDPRDVLLKLTKLKEIEFRDAIWKVLATPDFGFTTAEMTDEETGDVELGQFFPAQFEFNGEEATDYQRVMQEALARLMDKLGLTEFNVSSLYNALGTNPEQVKQEFYNIYNSIIKDITDLDLVSGEMKYPMFSPSDFIEATNHPIANLLVKYGEGLLAIDPNLSEEERKQAISELELTYTIPDIREQAINTLVHKQLIEWQGKGVETEAENIRNALENNATLKLIKDIKDSYTLRSPADDVMDILTKYLGDDNTDIVKMLQDLGSRWSELRDEGEFEITDIEKLKLEKSKEIIEIAKSLMAAMYRSSYLGDSMPYNKAINEFVKSHKEVQQNWEDLPVIDKSLGQSIYHSLDLYSLEIDEWIAAANRSTDNKIKSIKEAKAAYDGVVHSLLYSTLGADHWLLDGYSGDNDSAAQVTIYRNALKAIKSGSKTMDDIIGELLEKFNPNHVLPQITSEISPGLSTALFTDYDKFFHLMAYLAIDKAEYLKEERAFRKANPKVAYLATLEPAMLYAYALNKNPEVMYTAIDKVVDLASQKGLNMPAFYGLICTGIGGAGKTDAVARFVQFISGDTTTWLSGPTTSQLLGLQEIAPKGILKSKDDLMNQITNGVDLTTNREEGTGIDERLTLVVPNVEDKLNTANSPKLMLVDEATHYSNLLLQIISLWARKAGTTLTMLGDENLKGDIIKVKKFSSYQIINNLAREVLIGLRTPRLAVTLRTRNLWKTRNQSGIVHLLDPLRNASSVEDTEARKNELLQALDNDYFLDYWENKTDIHGDKIVKTLNEIDFTKLKDKTVAYIGDNFEEIQGKLGNNVKSFKTLLDVQGQEIDYVIADNIQDKFDYNDAFALLDGMQSLYTGISRSKVGGFIVDGEGVFSRIRNRRQDYTTESVNLSDEIITDLNTARDAEIEDDLNNIPEAEESEEIKEKSKKKEKAKKDSPNEREKLRKKIRDYEKPEEEFNGLYRAYSNIQLLGGVDKEDKTYLFDILGPGHVTYWHANGQRRDIGIFKDKGLLASTPEEKASLVYDLACLRSLFTFDKFDLDDKENLYLSVEEFNKLPDRVRELFGNDPGSFRNVKYYAVAEDYDPNTHSLIGNTTADKNEISFLKDDKGIDKVITILARIPSKSGITYTITLGAVANPDTWLAYIEKLPVPTDEIEKKAFLKWYDGQLNAINLYRLDLKDLVTNKEQEIDRPTFTSQTEIIPIGEHMPLADFTNSQSDWDKITKNFTISDVHVIVKDLLGINPSLSKDLLGKPVIYVSADPTLNPDKLRDIWEGLQRHRDSSNPVVRMIVLDNNGISFNSLYRLVFEDIYSTKIETLEGEEFNFSIPYETEAQAIRTFVGMWNFRANLINFNEKVKKFREENSWSEDELDEKVKVYDDLYRRAARELNGTETLSDTLFAKWLTEHPDVEGVKDTLTIRDFNQKTLSTFREFRLGYSKDGARIGRLYGVDRKLYAKPEETNGVYIIPSLAKLYEDVIKNYFKALVDPIFKNTMENLPEDKKIDLIDEKWYDIMLEQRKIRFGTEDASIIEATVPIEEDLHNFSYAIIKIPRNLRWKALKGKDAFLKAYNKPVEEGKPKPYRVTIKVNGQDKICDYLEIDTPFTFDGKSGILTSSNTPREGLIGEIKVEWLLDSGQIQDRYVDTRMDSFLSIMMHGIVAQKDYNKFNDKEQLHATDAPYPYGMFSDPVLAPKTEENYAAKVLTHRALFTTNVVPGSPLISFKLKRDTTTKKPKEKAKTIVSEEDKKIINIIDKVNSIAGITLIDGINSIPIGSTNKELYILSVINSYNFKMLKDKNLFDPNKIILNLGEQTLAQKYDNIKDFTELVILPDLPLQVKIGDSYYTLEVKDGDIIMEIKLTEAPDPNVQLRNGTKVYTMQNLKDFVIELANQRLPKEANNIKNLINKVIYKVGTGGRSGNADTVVDKNVYNPGKLKKTIIDKARNTLDDDVTDEILNYIDEWFTCP